jgi:hypothetical protein
MSCEWLYNIGFLAAVMNRKDTEYLKERIWKENMRTPNQTTSSIHVFYWVISETDSFTFSGVP